MSLMKYCARNVFLYAVLPLFFTLPQLACAQQQKPLLLLATVDNIPPFVFMEDGKLTGISIDIIHELARRAGFDVSIETYPWARVLRQVENGEIDGAFSAYETEQRKAFCLYTGMIHYDELRLATRKDKQFHFETIEDLYGKVIGKGRNVFVSDAFNAAVDEGKIILSETNDMNMSNIKKLHAGRVDAVIGSPEAMLRYAMELGVENDISLLKTPLREKIPAYLVLSKNSMLKNKREWQDRLTSVLNAMWADGTIQSINAKYVRPHE